MAKKYVYLFKEGDASMRNLLGGKGATLAEMTNLGLPVPQGFTVSVRSGARASMPGMMDTILNLGLNDVAVEGMAKKSGNPRWAYDSYRRFIQMFSDVVMCIDKELFEEQLQAAKDAKGVKMDTELDADDLKEVVKKYKEIYKREMGKEFPQDAKEQLLEAVTAVFRSWDNPRAIVYRRMNDIPASWGTAVNVQAMVFGNMGDDCGTGVAFTRNPSPSFMANI